MTRLEALAALHSIITDMAYTAPEMIAWKMGAKRWPEQLEQIQEYLRSLPESVDKITP